MDTKYREIYNIIKEEITLGKLKNNEKIDNEINLCKRFSCSRMTIKKALDMLVQDGLLYRRRGQGSFVRNSKNEQNLILLSERELTGLTKSTNSNIKSDIIEFKLVFANEVIANHLNMRVNDPLYSIRRLRYIKEEPAVIELTYMNPALIPGINETILNNSIYHYIENDLNLRIGAAKKTTRACICTKEDKQYLLLDDNEPILEVEQIAYLDNGTPFEYSFSRHRYDKFEFTTYSLRI